MLPLGAAVISALLCAQSAGYVGAARIPRVRDRINWDAPRYVQLAVAWRRCAAPARTSDASF